LSRLVPLPVLLAVLARMFATTSSTLPPLNALRLPLKARLVALLPRLSRLLKRVVATTTTTTTTKTVKNKKEAALSL
jgi:hypothetical protein